MKLPFMRSPYNYDVTEASDAAMIPADMQGDSLTVQSQAEDADLNVLMTRYGLTGKMPENVRIPEFGDYTGITDFQSAMNSVMEASDSFMELPAMMRARFENNPQLFLDFCSKEENRPEMLKMGLLKEQIARDVQPPAAPSSQGAPGPAIDKA